MNIIVVGGAESLIQGNLGRKFQDHGVKIGWHIASKGATLDSLPKACEGVVVIKDMVGHVLSEQAADLASRADLPLARVPRKWSKAEPLLRTTGILPPVTKGQVKKASPSNMVNLALEYVCEERRRGRTPKRSEVNSVLQRAFGPKTTISPGVFREVHSRACAAVPNIGEKLSPQQDYRFLLGQATDWAAALIKDNPMLALDYKDLANRVRENIGERSVLLKQEDLEKKVRVVHDKLKTEWRLIPRGSTLRNDRNTLMKDWLRDWFRAYQAGKDEYPTQKIARIRSKDIFDVQCRWDWIAECRADVLGEWAERLDGALEVYHSFHGRSEKRLPFTYEEFISKLKAGEIKSVKPGMHWKTSKKAVEEWLEGQESKIEESKAPEPEEPKEPEESKAPKPEAPKPKAESTDPPVVSAEDVAIAVASLIEGEVLKKVESLLAPLAKQVSTLQEQITDMRGVAEARFLAIEDAVRDQTDSRDDALETLAEGIIQHSAKDPVVALGATLGEVEANLSELTLQVKEMQSQQEQVAMVGFSSNLDDDMSLRSLAVLAKETGLAVSIQAGPRDEQP